MTRKIGLLLPLLFACILPLFAPAPETILQDEPTNREKQQLRRIKDEIDKAGRLYKADKLELSAEAIRDAQRRIQELAQGADAELLEIITPEYKRLEKAHQLLTNAGQTLRELAPLPPPMTSDGPAISFVKQVAPIIVARCGRCHVNQNRGDFSAASYQALGASTMIAVGLPNDSRMVEVIVDGDMPPNGMVPEAELETIKNWIAQGAKYDGDNPAQNLRQIARANNSQNQRPTIARPTGNETVSFGLHVAPILLESCGQCHIDTNNVRGNLNMGSFRQLLQGGDSGPPIAAGDSMASLIVQRMSATDGTVMPPSGKLDDKVIDVVRTWIDERAKFDGTDDVASPTRVVAAKALADSQTHEELAAARQALSQKNWKLIMSDIDPEQLSTEQFHVFGDVSPEKVQAIGKLAESIATKLKSTFKRPRAEPLIKGNATVFILESRYDLSELGKMIAKREIERELSGYWDYTTVDAYTSILMTRNKTTDDIRVPLAQQIASVYVASLSPDVPRWFAEGVGHWAAARSFSRDEAVKTWDNRAAEYAANMDAPDDFITGRIPDHQVALVSYAFVQQLRSKSGQFNRLMGELNDGKPFAAAFEDAFGATPNVVAGAAPENRQQPRRQRRR